jgi:hypothetical protein
VNDISHEKPKFIQVIGWTYLALSLITFISSVFGFTSYSIIKSGVEGELPMPEDIPEQFKIFWSLLPYYDIITLEQTILSAFVLVASIQFLRLRKWARTAIEIVSWLVVIFHMGFCIIWIYLWMGLSINISGDMGSGMVPILGIGVTVFGVLVILVLTIPFFVVIRYLRREKTRKVFM